ncbi:MAG: cytochrome b/b6 domain-containing protein, partial [Pseudomonadota bacterium]
ALPAHMPPWQQFVAKVTHVFFYGLMLCAPMIGWLMVSADPLTEQFPTKLFFLVPIPNLPVPIDAALSDRFTMLHAITAKATIGLIALHVAAGLKHHYGDKDDVLSRMVPGLKPKGVR